MNKKLALTESEWLIKKLIAARSYSGEENKAADLVAGALKDAGFTHIGTDACGSVTAFAEGRQPGRTLLFDSHLDTVPVPDKSLWSIDPFKPVVKNGRLYGRGASDMKSAIGCFIVAAKAFLKEQGNDFSGVLAFSGTVMEERFEGIAARAVSKALKPDLVMIGEASDCNIKIAQRGRAEIRLEVFGRPAHTSNPEKGINAVYEAMEVIRAMQKLRPPVHPFMGKGILELTDILSRPYPGASVVPEYCCATFDRRLLAGETPESVLAPIERLLKEMKKKDRNLNAAVSFTEGSDVCWTGKKISCTRFFPGWMGDAKAPFVTEIRSALAHAGLNAQLTRYDFCTNGSHYAGEAGIPAFGFGPSSESLAHTADEYVPVDQLEKAVVGYHAILGALLP